jgi:hypothetical protein
VLGKITRNPVILGRQLLKLIFRHGNKKKQVFFAALCLLQEGGGGDIVIATVGTAPTKLVLKQFWAIKKTPSSAPQLSIYSWKDK